VDTPSAVRLPVHEIESALKSAVSAASQARVLLKAPTGSGKSTAVPLMMLEAVTEGSILVIEPRRMAARLLAGWVARLHGTALGATVGYAVRFDTRYGRDTRLIYMTDGVFQRWMQENPQLKGVSAVVFDEFHERRLAVDVALGRCLDLQESTRPDLKLVVMSATLDTRNLAEYLGEATHLEAGGRTYPIEVQYRPDRPKLNDRRGGPAQETPVWERIAQVAKEALSLDQPGDLLCFLPGMHEIRKTVEALEANSVFRAYDVLPLHSGLPPAAQEAAVSPGPRPKIIVSTNVAETSLTIEGVRTVIDAGLARVASFDPRRGIDTLLIRKISRASAEQRAGRAGRTGPGRAFRLWSESEHSRREGFDAPEVRRVDLAEVFLLLKAAGISDPLTFRWLDAPSPESAARAEALLHDLGATDRDGHLTEEGRAMAALPLEPRYARLMLGGVEQGCVAEMAFIAAAVQGEGIFTNKRGSISPKDFIHPGEDCDFAGEWRAFQSASEMGYDPKRCGQLGIIARGAREIAQGFERLQRLAHQRGWPWGKVDFAGNREAVGRAMLSGFSDRLGVRFSQGTLACKVVGNRRGKLDDESSAKQAAAFVAAEMTEVEGREVIVQLRRATAIDLSWLREIFPEDVQEFDGVAFDDTRRRVVSRKELKFRDLVLESKESDHGVNLNAAAELLAQRVISGELILKNWDAAVDQWCARLGFLSQAMPDLGLPTWTEEDRESAIAQICHGAVSHKDIKEAEVWPVLREWLNHSQSTALSQHAPERLKLSNGQSVKVTYEPGKDPWIAIRVQHLFGVWQTPTIAGGRVPLLVHILAPSQRPWQMTKDLNNFWANGYKQMKKELAGRYPRQAWPDDPKQGV
jgi:ATP-dependent helicase HrpB